MKKIPFNHNINEDVGECFDKVSDKLPGHKYQQLEAAIRAFAALPEDFQMKLLSGQPENRQFCLDLIGRIAELQKQPQFFQKNKSSKSG